MIFKPQMCNFDLFLMFSGHFHAWPVLLMRPQGSCYTHAAGSSSSIRFIFNSATIFMLKLFLNSSQARPGSARQAVSLHKLLHVSCCWHPPTPASQDTQNYMDINEAHTLASYAWPPCLNECLAQNNNFSADVIFISTYVHRSKAKRGRGRGRGSGRGRGQRAEAKGRNQRQRAEAKAEAEARCLCAF